MNKTNQRKKDRPKETSLENKCKAWLVTRDFKDKKVYDLKKTYAPVSRMSPIRATTFIDHSQ